MLTHSLSRWSQTKAISRSRSAWYESVAGGKSYARGGGGPFLDGQRQTLRRVLQQAVSRSAAGRTSRMIVRGTTDLDHRDICRDAIEIAIKLLWSPNSTVLMIWTHEKGPETWQTSIVESSKQDTPSSYQSRRGAASKIGCSRVGTTGGCQ